VRAREDAAPSSAIARLVAVLTREQAVYSELVNVTALERETIVKGQLTELKVVVERKQAILARLARLEDRRLAWLRRYAHGSAVGFEGLTLARIIEVSEPKDRRILTRLHRGLTRRIQQLKELDQVTRALLDGILQSIDSSLRYLLSEDNAGLMYGAQGSLQPSPVARQLLDRQA
jgi:flagellar biosynthesis/type III secretory pathway chaperone